jgi:hypothetical protein
MHPLFSKADKLTAEVINAAIEEHRIMGPGLLESIYERCSYRSCSDSDRDMRRSAPAVAAAPSAIYEIPESTGLWGVRGGRCLEVLRFVRLGQVRHSNWSA